MLGFSLIFSFFTIIGFLGYGAVAGIAFYGYQRTHRIGFMHLAIASLCWMLSGLQSLIFWANDFFHLSMQNSLDLFRTFSMVFSTFRLAGIVLCAIGVLYLAREYPSSN
jgi:hypothetical protein